ncbi:MAG: SRPBCC family protein [Proteobacteria bacterium]|nr:SRPBCC family protein [Pseudomonadota bacterium]
MRCLLILTGLLVLAPAAGASPPVDPAKQRLPGFSRADLTLLAPLLADGPVGLVEFADNALGELPAVNMAVNIDAPADTVVRLISEPQRYPDYLKTVGAVSIAGRHGSSTVYDWAFRVAIFRLTGRNVMHVYAPRKAADGTSYRTTVRSMGGDMGTGRSLFRVWSRPSGDSLLAISMRQDLREANYLTRKLMAASSSINRSANVSLCMSLLLGFKREAERLGGRADPGGAATGQGQHLHKPSVQTATLLPLLFRGDLVWLAPGGEARPQLAVLGLLAHSIAQIRGTLLDANSFGAALMPGSYAKVSKRQDNYTFFDWGVRLPLIGVSGSMRLHDEGDVVAADAMAGAFRGGRWRFSATPLSPNLSAVLSWARFDLRHASWLIDRLVNVDPYLEQGLAAASQVMLVRALRSRMRKQAQATAAAAQRPASR